MSPSQVLNKSDANGHHFTDVDRAISELKQGELTPPPYGDQHRHAITACVDGVVSTLSEKIAALRQALDRVEQNMLQSAAKAKVVLDGHINACQHVDGDIRHLQVSIETLESQTRDL